MRRCLIPGLILLAGCGAQKTTPWVPPAQPTGASARVPADYLAYHGFQLEETADTGRITFQFEAREPMSAEIQNESRATVVRLTRRREPVGAAGRYQLKVTLQASRDPAGSGPIQVEVEQSFAPVGSPDGPSSSTRAGRVLPEGFLLPDPMEITNLLPSGKLWERPIKVGIAEIRPKTGAPFLLVLDAKR